MIFCHGQTFLATCGLFCNLWQLLACIMQLLLFFSHFCQLLACLASFCIYWQLFGTNFGNLGPIFWHPLATFGSFGFRRSLLADFGHFWATFYNFFVNFSKFKHLFATLINFWPFWQLLATVMNFLSH